MTLFAVPFAQGGAAAKRGAGQCDDHPDALRILRHGTAVTGIAEDHSVPEGQAKSEQAPIRRPPYSNFARMCKVATKAFFSLDRAIA